MAMIETTNLRRALFHRRSPEQGYSLLDRILTLASAQCSYPGCNRLRHVGPCHVDEQENESISQLYEKTVS